MEVGCFYCTHPTEPCRGKECDHFHPPVPWLRDVMEDEKCSYPDDFFEEK